MGRFVKVLIAGVLAVACTTLMASAAQAIPTDPGDGSDPPPNPCANSTGSLTAPSTMYLHQPFTVSWSTQRPGGCGVYSELTGPGTSGALSGMGGSQTVEPPTVGISTYSVTIFYPGGSMVVASQSLAVLPLPDAPRVAAARNADGRVAMFGVTDPAYPERFDAAVQRAPGTGLDGLWSETRSFHSAFHSVAAETSAGGRIWIFATDVHGNIFQRWQTAQNSSTFSPWSPIDGGLTSIAAARQPDGRIAIFGTNWYGNVWSRTESAPDSSSFDPWVLVSGAMTQVAAETNADGRIVLLGIDSAGQVHQRVQTAPNVGTPNVGTWTDWSGAITNANSLAVARAGDGRLTLIMDSSPTNVSFVYWSQTTPGAMTWAVQGGSADGHGGFAAEANSDGRIEIFGWAPQGGSVHRGQQIAGGADWTGWSSLSVAAVEPGPVTCIGFDTCAYGDVNGDHVSDAVGFVKSTVAGSGAGDVFVSLGDPLHGDHLPATKWSDWMCVQDEVCRLADVNNDQLADVVAFVRSSRTGTDEGDVWVALSTGTGFSAPQKWSDRICVQSENCALADVDGDQKADAVSFVTSGAGAGQVWVASSTGTGFRAAALWSTTSKCDNADVACFLAYYDNDARADIIVKPVGDPNDRTMWVSPSTGSSFGAPTLTTLPDPDAAARDNSPAPNPRGDVRPAP